MTPRGLRTHSLLIALVLLIGTAQTAAADYRIGVVLSSRLQPYVEALQGFQDTIGAAVPVRGPKSLTYAEVREYVLAEEKTRATLRREILADHPDLLLAIGTNALTFLRTRNDDIPIIYLMVPYPAGIVNGRTNITGINLQIGPARQLDLLLDAVPALNRFGLIYDPLRSGATVKEIQAAAADRNIGLLAKQATTSSAVQGLLEEMAGRIDCFWMLPDLTVVTPETVELILLFSLQHRVPIFSFSAKYLIRGAAFAVTFDNYHLGQSAAEMAMQILAGQEVETLEPREPQKIRLQINRRVVNLLGIPVSHTEGNSQ